MSFDLVANIIKSYSDTFKRFGDVSIYNKVRELLGDKEADEFMLSDKGGYDYADLVLLKKQLEYQEKRKIK